MSFDRPRLSRTFSCINSINFESTTNSVDLPQDLINEASLGHQLASSSLGYSQPVPLVSQGSAHLHQVDTFTDCHHVVEEKKHFAPIIVMVLDASGSMCGVASDIRTAVNTFIDEQKAGPVDNAKMSMIVFADEARTIFNKKPITEVQHITADDYRPDGWTALNDAIGLAIMNHNDEPDALVVIVTDGEENKSSVFTHAQISSMIDAKKASGWKFIYLANDRSIAEQGYRMGISAADSGTAYTTSNNLAVGMSGLAPMLSRQVSAAAAIYRSTTEMPSIQLDRSQTMPNM